MRLSLHAKQGLGSALIVGIILGFGVARSANAQGLPDSSAARDSAFRALMASADSLYAKADSILKRSQPVPSRWTMTLKAANDHSAAAYGGMIGGALVINWFARIDKDPCASGARVCFGTSYHDSFSTPDKLAHFNAAYFLTSSAMSAGVPPKWAFGLTCGLAGAGFEITQGAVAWRDITADCVGSATAVALRKLTLRKKAAGWLHR